MKKSLLVISMMLALAMAVGCYATKGDLEEVQARDSTQKTPRRSPTLNPTAWSSG